MSVPRIQPIVEGYGEVSAVPVLLRRLIMAASVVGLDVGRPIRQKQSQLLHEDGLRKAVRLARLQEGCGAIIILFESEDSCPRELGPQLNAWAASEAGNLPCGVVLAHREYEAWFLATLESLRGRRGISDSAVSHSEPESVRGAKEELESHLPQGRSYYEISDKAALTARFDMKAAYAKCRSFRRLVKVFGELVNGMGIQAASWPPPDWIGGTAENGSTL